MNKEILVSFLILDSNKQFSLAVQYDSSFVDPIVTTEGNVR